MEGVLPLPKIRPRMQKLSVGLCAPCDPPGVEQVLLEYFTKQFPEGQSLPFIAWITHDMKWVHGFWGGRTLEQFEADLAIVEKSPLVPATEEVEQRLQAALGEIEKHVAADRWADVLAVARRTADLRGRCDERDRLGEFVAEARDWIQSRFDWVEEQALDERDLAPARKELAALAKAFKGEPEADEAALGTRALDALRNLRKLEGDAREKARSKAVARFEGSRWAALFETGAE